jgi:hypothetical protein
MTDILEQWRSAKERWIISGEANEMIVGLETEIERLREALREIAEGDRPDSDEQFCVGYWGATARAALGEGKE